MKRYRNKFYGEKSCKPINLIALKLPQNFPSVSFEAANLIINGMNNLVFAIEPGRAFTLQQQSADSEMAAICNNTACKHFPN